MTKAKQVVALALAAVGLAVTASLVLVALPVPAAYGAPTAGSSTPMQAEQVPATTLSKAGGVLNTSEIWGPGLITLYGDLVIQPGIVLTILPGTTIKMDAADAANLGVDSRRIEWIVRGTLHTEGPVAFTSLRRGVTCGDWYGLRFLPGSSGSLQDTLVERAVHGVELNTNTSSTISGSTLRFNCHQPPIGDAWGAGLTILAGTHYVVDTEIYGNMLLASGPQGRAIGAGVWLAAGNTLFERCRVYENIAQSTGNDGLGGGLALWGGGQPTLRRCDVHHNRVTAAGRALGGGVEIDNADAVLEAKTTIRENTITALGGAAYGGAIAIVGPERVPAPTIRHSQVVANRCYTSSVAGCFGAGIGFAFSASSGGQSQAAVYNNLVADNVNEGQAANGGAIGMEAGTAAAQIDGNIIRGNLAQAGGGQACGAGICLAGSNAVRVTNNLLFGNQASAPDGRAAEGGGLYANGAMSYLSNNTVVNNVAKDGGGVYLANGTLYNTIVASNQASNDGGGVSWYGGNAGFNDVWANAPNDHATSGWPRPATDIQADPQFVGVGTLADAYHLEWQSLCVDAGTPAAPAVPDYDVDHQSRPQGATWDIGFDEAVGFDAVKQAGAAVVNAGGLLRYSIVLSNSSNTASLTDASIRDPLPRNARLFGGPNCSLPACGKSDGELWWQGDVPAGGQVTLAYTVTVDYGLQITNATHFLVGTVTGWSDPVTTAINSPALTITKEASDRPVAGIPFTYTLVVTNASPFVAASGVVVTDAVPPEGKWVSGGYHDDGLVTLTLPDILPLGRARASWVVSTCQSDLTNEWYRVVTSTAHIASGWGRPLAMGLRAPELVPSLLLSSDQVKVGEAVTFTDRSTFDGLPLVARGWDFGDGERGSGRVTTHIYSTVANYSVTLTITDGCGYHATTQLPDAIAVSPPPICTEVTGVDLTQITSGPIHTGDTIQFRADISPDNAQKRYLFRLIVDGTLGFRLTSGKDPLTFDHSFATPGRHTITITVWNCRMPEAQAIADEVEVWVVPRPGVHLPMILKNHRPGAK